ncbi:hypothetical protein EDB84DRAFT_746553 [Lactarius hengduanensis]|nr:hypothetical protein EDB84DRAFT_746553 [Lactarius hengduanensis]
MITTDPATPRRRVRRSSQQDRTANSTTNDVTWPTHGDPENASRNTSSPVSAVDLVTSIGVGPLRRSTSEYHGNSGQPLRTMTSSGSSHSLSSPSSPVGPSRVYEHAGFPRRGFSTSWPDENRRINEQGTAGSPGASNTATQHGEAGAVGTSTDIGQRTRESPSPALLRLLQTGHLIHEVQPAHRRSPRMPMYPSLPGQDPELLSLSGLDIGFGPPAPRLSPTQVQAVVRPPSMDPRSPVPTQMRIPGDIMEPVFFGRPTPPPSTTRTFP